MLIFDDANVIRTVRRTLGCRRSLSARGARPLDMRGHRAISLQIPISGGRAIQSLGNRRTIRRCFFQRAGRFRINFAGRTRRRLGVRRRIRRGLRITQTSDFAIPQRTQSFLRNRATGTPARRGAIRARISQSATGTPFSVLPAQRRSSRRTSSPFTGVAFETARTIRRSRGHALLSKSGDAEPAEHKANAQPHQAVKMSHAAPKIAITMYMPMASSQQKKGRAEARPRRQAHRGDITSLCGPT